MDTEQDVRNGRVRASKIHSSIKAIRKLTKIININFFITLEIS